MSRVRYRKAGATNKVAQKVKTVVTIWRSVIAAILFVIIYPTFLATHTKDNFYLIVLLTTVAVVCTVFIIERPLRPKFRSYFVKARFLLLALAAYVPLSLPAIRRQIVLLPSAAAYAMAAQRLGLGYSSEESE